MTRARPTGGVRRRGSIWWIYYRHQGRQWDESAKTGDERAARSLLAQRRREIRDGTWQPPSSRRVVTVEIACEEWIARRKADGIVTVGDERTRLKAFVLPHIGSKPLAEVTRADVRDLVAAIQREPSPLSKKMLAPRSVHHVYGVLRSMFADAVERELVASTPCTLSSRRKGGGLPQKRDADPRWREDATYTRAEIEALLSPGPIPIDRRLYYALLALGGLRAGEAAGVRWRDYNADAEPLGRLLVATQNDDAELKTKIPRRVPVHPTLAALIAEWKVGGFAMMFLRHPRPDDFIVPSRAGVDRPRSKKMVERLAEDLAILGLRAAGRGRHAMRAAFRSLAIEAGANPTILDVVMWAKGADVRTGYERFPWRVFCDEVGKLPVEIRRGADVIALPLASNDARRTDSGTDSGAAEAKKAPQKGAFLAGWTGLEPAASGVTGRRYNRLNYHPKRERTW